jgi:aspartate kinase
MIVMKFGGTSVGDAANIRRVVELVRARLKDRPCVVVSAHSGVTDALLDQAHKAVSGKHDLAGLHARHAKIAEELGVEVPAHAPLLQELADLLRGISLVAETTPRLLDQVASFGERLSVHTVAAALAKAGIPAEAVMAFDAGLQTDSRYQRARPLPQSYDAIAKFFRERGGDDPAAGGASVAVVTGFLAKDAAGSITTLGRNGSDYSASLFGRALHASEIEIWTDVPGVMTADPRLVPDARPIECMTYDEAAEIAFCGGKVLHPATLHPAVEADIPVRVLDTRNPTGPNTVIWREVPASRPVVRTVVQKRGICLVNVVTPRMLGAHGYMARVFDAAGRHEVALDMIATTEISVSMTVDDDRRRLGAFLDELRALGEVTVERNVTVVAVVGHAIGESPQTLGAIFSTLAHEGIAPRMVSMGARRTNVGIVVDEADTAKAVNALHGALLNEPRLAKATAKK